MGVTDDFAGQDADKSITVGKDSGGQSFKGAKSTPSEQIAAWGGINGSEESVDQEPEKAVKVYDGTEPTNQ